MPWKRSIQLGTTIAVATSATTRSVRRETRTAINGTLAIAKNDETSRNSTRPPPVCAIIQAKRKWSGAPPRSPSTVRMSSPTEPRLAKSASVSSSCGGHTVSRAKKNAAASAVSPATPMRHNVSGDAESATERARSAVVVAALFTLGLSRHAASLDLCRRTSTVVLTGTFPRCSSRSTRRRPKGVPCAARARSRSCCTRSPCISRARASTRRTTAAAAGGRVSCRRTATRLPPRRRRRRSRRPRRRPPRPSVAGFARSLSLEVLWTSSEEDRTGALRARVQLAAGLGDRFDRGECRLPASLLSKHREAPSCASARELAGHAAGPVALLARPGRQRRRLAEHRKDHALLVVALADDHGLAVGERLRRAPESAVQLVPAFVEPSELHELERRQIGHERLRQPAADERKLHERAGARHLVQHRAQDVLLTLGARDVGVRRVEQVLAHARVDHRTLAAHVQ